MAQRDNRRRRTVRRANGGRDRTRPDARRPDMPWAVVGVIGDDDAPAFGYTNGLHEFYGHPELWMGGVAANDPLALEWCTTDIGIFLNQLAARVRDGEVLEPGTTHPVCVCNVGLDLDFVVGEPIDRLEVEALLIDPAAQVLPVRWMANWVDGPPASWPRTPTGGVRCPCRSKVQEPGCAECEREARAGRRTGRCR